MSLIEMFWIGVFVAIMSIFIANCSSASSFNNDMLKMNLAHFDQKTGKFVLDSLSCHNDTCIIIRK